MKILFVERLDNKADCLESRVGQTVRRSGFPTFKLLKKSLTDGPTDGLTDRHRTDQQTDGWMDRWMYGWMESDGQTDWPTVTY